MSREYPIIMSSEMVRAILDGRKTQTRRIIKPQPDELKPLGPKGCMWPYRIGKKVPDMGEHRVWAPIKCSYGKVGDRLWVREGFQIYDGRSEGDDFYGRVHGKYLSDGQEFISVELTEQEFDKWHDRKKQFAKTSGRFMYKSLARIWLEITGIRVERVQDITTKDILAEGIVDQRCGADGLMCDFATLWDSINAKRGYGWSGNPWVWVISFKRIEANR